MSAKVSRTVLKTSRGVTPRLSQRERASAEAPAEYKRDVMGQFAPGNQGGPGNPFGRLMGMLRCARDAEAS